MPFEQFEANAAFFRICVIALNLLVLFKHFALCGDWQRNRVAMARWCLFHLSGKVVRRTHTLMLKIANESVELFQNIRTKSYQFAQSLAP